jgi:hypothetical protein
MLVAMAATIATTDVGVQVGRDPAALVRADETEARWELELDVVDRGGQLDFRGLLVHGRRGERFIYLTWGELGPDGRFEMFRRAKLMLNRIDQPVLAAALRTGRLLARVDLTGSDGGPRCARVDPPAIEWSAPPQHRGRDGSP